ncbi:hypothetical protein HDU84_005471 [Entophlyctis sp. JEL0112]|nr:hypothetical protein HDU84_005471 [Entophlyctis sp. JEL0112]
MTAAVSLEMPPASDPRPHHAHAASREPPASPPPSPSPSLSLFQILLLRAVPWKMLLQRLPGVLIVFVVVLGLLGPAYAPYFYASYLLAVHVLSANAAIRIAYGSKVAVAQAVRHSTTDWPALYCSLTGSAHTADLSHDLPFDDVDHVIIIPGYKESEDTWCETLDVLASHSRAVSHYKICLAMEQADEKAEQMAMMLVSRYIDCFLQVVYTIHPKGLPGETAGKHSNVSWAARQMTRKSKSVKSDIITVMDCDTAFAEDYFLAITCHFASASKQDRMMQMFAPSTVFDRNADDVPVFVRLADMIWSAGVMGNYVPFSPISIPCSAYSLPMELAQAVDFWDVGSEGLGEDMHMFLKIFFATEGRVTVTPVYSPASCCNIEGKKGSGVIGAMYARYGQAKRHLWGCLDSGYALRKALFTIVAPGYDNVIIGRLPASASKAADGKRKPAIGSISIANDEVHFNLYKLLVLFHRLAEAHIIGGHLTILLIMSALLPLGASPSAFSQRFWSALTTHGIHPVVVLASDVCGYIRIVSLLSVVALAVYYEQYHAWVGALRWQYSAAATADGVGAVITTERDARLFGVHVGPGKRVQHLGRRPGLQSLRSAGERRWRVYFDWCALPITALLYQSIPQFHAQLLQLWTDSLLYETAAKPELKRPAGTSALQQAEEASGVVHVFGGHERMPGEIVEIPSMDMDDVETLVNTRSGGSTGGPDEILVLQGLKAHRIGANQTPPPPLALKHLHNGPAHSHTNSFSNFNEFDTNSTLMTLSSFPASPRLVGAYVQQPPPPYMQVQRSASGANSPPAKTMAQYFDSASLMEKEPVSGWMNDDVAVAVGGRSDLAPDVVIWRNLNQIPSQMDTNPDNSPSDGGHATLSPDSAVTALEVVDVVEGVALTTAPDVDDTNPHNWPPRKKWTAVTIAALYTFLSPISSTMVAPALPYISNELGFASPTQTELVLSLFVLAYAVGPLVLGPLSEIYGRYVVLQSSLWFYVATNALCGVCQSPAPLLLLRFLSGLGGSAALVLSGSVVSDCFAPHEVGGAMSYAVLGIVVGPALGPIIGGFVTVAASWRWLFYVLSIFGVVLGAAGTFLLPETFEPVLRRRKYRNSEHAGGKANTRAAGGAGAGAMLTAIGRPFVMLATQPIVQLVSLIMLFVYGVLFIVLATFSALFVTQYGEPTQISTLHYIALGLGFLVGNRLSGYALDASSRFLQQRYATAHKPEYRLPVTIPAALLLPVGLLLYGWTAEAGVFWLAPDVGIFLASISINLTFQALTVYTVDVFRLYSASALATINVLRFVAGFAFPLFAAPLYDRLGYGWGNSALAFVAIALGIPAPMLLYAYGERIRANSPYATD